MKICESRAVTLILLLIFSLVSGFNVIDIHAQTPLSKIVGTVKDQTGGVVVAAKVTLTDEGRGYQHSTISDQDGNYTIDLLLDGSYALSCELQGFKTHTRTKIPLQSRQVLRIDVALEVGEVTDSVTVNEAAPVVASETGEVQARSLTRQVVDKDQGHAAFGFFFAAQFVPYGGFSSVVTSYRGPGTTSNQLRSRVEGLEIDNNLPATPPDFVEDVKVSYSGLKSEAQSPLLMDVHTRGGTNQFHGLFEVQGQNPALNALGPNPSIQRSGGQTTNLLWYGRVSGPVVLPGVYNGRGRTFFWAGLSKFPSDGLAKDRPAFFIAPLAWRTGDFSKAPASFFTNPSKTLINPFTGQGFPGGVIPANLIQPIAKNIQSLTPAPNTGNLADPHDASTLNWRDTGASGRKFFNQNLNIFNLRLDHRLTEKDTLTYTYMRIYSNYDWDISQGLNSFQEKQLSQTDSHLISWTRAFSPSLLNEFRAGIARSPSYLGPLLDEETSLGHPAAFAGGGLAALQSLGFTYSPSAFSPTSKMANALPAVCISGVLNPLCDFGGSGGRLGVNDRFLENRHIIDNLSINRRAHSFKTGVDYVRILDASQSGNPFGNFQFDGRFTGLPYADYLLGLPSTSTRAGILPRPYRQAGWIAGYFQDDWKIRSDVTLELGIRFEHFPVVKEKNLMMVNFDPKTASFVVPNETSLRLISPAFPIQQFAVVTAAQAGYPKLLREYPQAHFYPRFGIAWRPFNDAKTVVRAGIGQFSSAPTTAQSLVSSSPYALNETFDNLLTNGQPAFSFPNPFPTGTGRVPGQTAFGVSPEFPVPYSHNWNLSVEREIFPNTSVRLSYLGAKVTQLGYRRDINKPASGPLPFRSDCPTQPAGTCVGPVFPKFNGVSVAEPGANENAHTMEVELHRRFTDGLQFTVDYAWNKTLTDAQDTGDYRGGSDYGPLIENPYDRSRDKAIHGRTAAHRLVFVHAWDLPLGRGRKWLGRNRLLDAVVGGWTLVGRWPYSSRVWVTPVWSGSDFSNTGTFTARPDVVPGCNPTVDNFSASRIFDLNCFVRPPDGRFGNAGRNSFRGVPLFGSVSAESYLNLFKTFKLIEKGLTLRVGAYMYNPLNHPFLFPRFGYGYSDVNQVTINSPNSDKAFYTGSRTIRIAARLEF